MTNNLQRKLRSVQKEKEELEKRLREDRDRLEHMTAEKSRLLLDIEREQEYLTNNLQKELRRIKEEKRVLELRLEEERQSFKIRKSELEQEKTRLLLEIEREEENLTNNF